MVAGLLAGRGSARPGLAVARYGAWRHTRRVWRLISILAAAGVSQVAIAQADPPADQAPSVAKVLPGKHHQDFWAWLEAPFGKQIRLIIDQASANQQAAQAHDAAPWDPYSGAYRPVHAARRQALLRDAVGMLAYAEKLDPEHLEVARALAIATDELGDPRARPRLEHFFALAADHDHGPARVRLGRWYAATKHYRRAIDELRVAAGATSASSPAHREALLLLACLYMHTDQLPDAIALLAASELSPTLSPIDATLRFALAVAYDRAGQISMAHETLRALSAAHPDALVRVLRDASGRPLVFVPPSDRAYFAALQFEALGYLIDARTEWQHYLAWPDARYKARARNHIQTIDALLTKSQAQAPATSP